MNNSLSISLFDNWFIGISVCTFSRALRTIAHVIASQSSWRQTPLIGPLIREERDSYISTSKITLAASAIEASHVSSFR